MEQQTDAIVQAIQGLLAAMKYPSTQPETFDQCVGNINNIVRKLADRCRTTLSTPAALNFKTRGELILQDLIMSNDQLKELGLNIRQQPESKALKQKVASSSYEIAKVIRERLMI